MAMIEAPLRFFQMQVKCCVRDAFKFDEPNFGKAPEAFNLLDMHATS
jgi:hypothetical protein